MKTILKSIMHNICRAVVTLALPLGGVGGGLLLTSCQDFFDVDSTYIINADENHLTNANDSIYSVIGILNKLQAIADRTVLLGEARADLVDVTSATAKDLRDLALFNVGEDNKYNDPRDYYAVINNCNYFIANADTAMENNRGENIFLNEYAVVKAVRAWTYLQLALNYGEVPFVTQPILTKEDAERDYPKKDILGICEYFINEDGLQTLADNENVTYPNYGLIKNTPSRLFFFPLNVVLGDLYLWKASYTNQKNDYLDAAKRYYAYINTRNGRTTSSAYPVGDYSIGWGTDSWNKDDIKDSWYSLLVTESDDKNSEVITIIPMDSVRSEGYYSDLRSIFCTSYNDNQNMELTVSNALKDISANQQYCYYDWTNHQATVVPKGLDENLDGDLRLSSAWMTSDNAVKQDGTRYTSQYIYKFLTKNGNIHIYRRSQVYLRLAEALNRAGYPRYAFQILQSGVNNDVINRCVTPVYSKEDSTMILNNFSFPAARYIVGTYIGIDGSGRILSSTAVNTIGIHSRGCGMSPLNPFYQMPFQPFTITVGDDVLSTSYMPITAIVDENGDEIYSLDNLRQQFIAWDEQQRDWQIEQVEDLIINENVLELAFEGQRFYDLMRVSIRRNDPSYLANRIKARRGAGNDSGITVDLTDKRNWFLTSSFK